MRFFRSPPLLFLLVLPVAAGAQTDTLFKSFTVAQTSQGVLIQFTIRGGVTCSGVKIERATDTAHFSAIHEFIGVCGNLNYDESYSYTDTDPVLNTWSQYRLELGSLGLFSSLRHIRYLEYGSDGFVVFPNPCNSNCAVYFTNTTNVEHEAALFDTDGKKVFESKVDGSQWNPETSGLPPGLYLYRISRDKEVRFSGKLLIL
jgi:hypothetical protein